MPNLFLNEELKWLIQADESCNHLSTNQSSELNDDRKVGPEMISIRLIRMS